MHATCTHFFSTRVIINNGTHVRENFLACGSTNTSRSNFHSLWQQKRGRPLRSLLQRRPQSARLRRRQLRRPQRRRAPRSVNSFKEFESKNAHRAFLLLGAAVAAFPFRKLSCRAFKRYSGPGCAQYTCGCNREVSTVIEHPRNMPEILLTGDPVGTELP